MRYKPERAAGMNHDASTGGSRRPQRDAGPLRAGLVAAAIVPAAGCGGSPASASPSPARDSGCLYRANSGTTIGRARLDGTDVNQLLITGANSPDAMATDSRCFCWANFGSGTIGRARFDGTGISQSFLSVHGHPAVWPCTRPIVSQGNDLPDRRYGWHSSASIGGIS
jgi:hypothetical protein